MLLQEFFRLGYSKCHGQWFKQLYVNLNENENKGTQWDRKQLLSTCWTSESTRGSLGK